MRKISGSAMNPHLMTSAAPAARQGFQQAHVGDDGDGRVEGTDQVLTHRRVDAGLAAHSGIDHAQQRGRHVDELDAAQPRGRDEARHVGGRSPAHGDNRVLAAQLEAPAGVPQTGDDLDRFTGLGVWVIGGGSLVPEGTQVGCQGLGSGRKRAGVDDEDLRGRLVKRAHDRGEAKIAADGDGRGLVATDLDGGAHWCSKWLRMSVTTSSTGPGPVGTVTVATAR